MTVPYIVRRTTGEGRKRFVTVFEGHAPGDPLVRGVALRDDGAWVVDTADGRDTIVCMAEDDIAVSSVQDGKVALTCGDVRLMER